MCVWRRHMADPRGAAAWPGGEGRPGGCGVRRAVPSRLPARLRHAPEERGEQPEGPGRSAAKAAQRGAEHPLPLSHCPATDEGRLILPLPGRGLPGPVGCEGET